MNKTLTLYHGDNHNTTELSPSLMANGYCQLGVGIYFSPKLDVAKYYGKHIVTTIIESKYLVEATEIICDTITKRSDIHMVKMLRYLYNNNPTAMYDLLANFGAEIREPQKITLSNLAWLSSQMKEGQIRNLTIELAEQFGTELFVEAWNMFFPRIKGFYQIQTPDNIWVAIIDNTLPVTKY